MDQDIIPTLPKYVPHLLAYDVQSGKSDFNCKKASIDFINAIAKTLPHALSPFKPHLLALLNNLRFDRVKPVRDACLEAIKALKTVEDPPI